MAIPPVVKMLNDAGISDGVLRQFCLQEPRNDKSVLDAIDAAMERRSEQIDRLGEIALMVERGEM